MKFGEISEDVKDLLDEVIEGTGLFNYMNIYYYSVDKQKTVIKVSKLNPLAETVAKKPDSVIITVRESIFERLSPNQQKMLVEDAMSQVLYDTEKEKISIESPAITMTASGWRKYGKELADTYELCLLTAQQLEEEEKEAKEAMKEARKKRKEE